MCRTATSFETGREHGKSWAKTTRTGICRTEVLASSKSAASKANSSGDGEPAISTAVVTVDGGWIGLNDAARLRVLTGSGAALLRADDFVARASATPDYYRFAGIPATEAEFLKTLGVDAATIERLRANAGANLIISGVTLKPRRVVWSQGPLGGVYQTLDVATVDARRDPIRRPLSAAGANLTYDAGEWFAMAPNGLWRVALYDAEGKLQQTVPDKIAKDTSDAAADGIVTPLISCIRCHTESGLRPFRDDQSRLFASGRVDLRSEDSTLAQRAAEFYDEPRLLRQMEFDRQTYAAAAARATDGMQAEEIATALGRAVREFAYQPLGKERAARELGLSAAEPAAGVCDIARSDFVGAVGRAGGASRSMGVELRRSRRVGRSVSRWALKTVENQEKYPDDSDGYETTQRTLRLDSRPARSSRSLVRSGTRNSRQLAYGG